MSRRRERQQTPRNRVAAIGLSTVFIGLLLGLAFLPGATGVPVTLAQWQRRLLGLAAPMLPAYVLVAGLVLIAAGERARLSRRVVGILLLSMTALMLLHARTAAGDLLASGLTGHGGGVLGGSLTWVIARGLGRAGLWVTLGICAAVSIGLIGGVSMSAVGATIRALARGTGVLVVVMIRLIWRLVGLLGRIAAAGAGRLLATGAPAAVRAARDLRRLAASGMAMLAAVASSLLARTRIALLQRQAVAEPVPATAGPPLDLIPGTTPAAAPAPETESPAAANAGSDAASAEGEAAASTGRRRPRRAAARGSLAEGEQARLDFASVDYQPPPLSLLGDATNHRSRTRVDPADTARALEQTLESFGVKVKVVHWEVGPVVTRYEVQPDPGVKVQKITSLTNDIALNLAAQSVRIEAPIPGKSAVGIELPNQKASLVHLREILTADAFQKATTPLVVGIGKDIAGHPIVADLTEMPHLLIAGATGSGKSVALNAMIASMLFRSTPRQVRLVMIDPKRVELTDYNDVPHLLTPVVTNPRQAASVLKDMLRVMEQRFELFARTGVRNIQAYNQLADVEPLYYIVIIIDELADLMMVAPADFEDIICRLAQMTRATGIHLMVATQRPSVDVITGLIKANIPSRLAFAVSSQVDSRTILDSVGAEKLLGRGDMLFLPLGASRAVRAQGAYIGDDEIRTVVDWWRQQGAPVYDQQLVTAQERAATDESADGERLMEAARLCVRSGYGSVSLLQRKMRIGYVTAARLIDELEGRGIVGPVQGSNPREVLIGLDDLERMLRRKSSA